ncbi:MAG TPA: energy-coupling factor transporter ATPase [Bacillota bacterium]|jgi:energy-coupling factor transport system ATP-binding protein
MPVKLSGVSHTYLEKTPFETKALIDVDLEVADGEFLGIIGPTGSGKSTLIQIIDGLIKPTSGQVVVDGLDLLIKANLRAVRRRVGLIFQYPEHQLFEESVLADVSFGPKNLGLSEEEVAGRAREALRLVGLDPEKTGPRSPFALSGGQMRRVAIAGVLAMRPSLLILDEPAAGLDPRGRGEILGYVHKLHAERGQTVILVSHHMEDVARLADRVVVMNHGRVVMDAPTAKVFGAGDELSRLGLRVPPVVELMQKLKERGWSLEVDALTVEEAAARIIKAAPAGPSGGVRG